MNAPYAPSQSEGPWVDIDLSALCENYRMIKETAPNAATAAVVKCNAYGLGAETISQTLADREGCDRFFVVYAHEGAALRRSLSDISPAPEIYVFGGPDNNTLKTFKDNDLIPVLNTSEQAAMWARAFPGAPACLHADTGMNRFGAPISALHDISEIDGLNITVFMSHLACASTPDHEMNKRQRALFVTAAQKFPKALKSLAASGGALMGEDYHFDLLRPGIALYGGSPFSEPEARIKSVAALRAPVVQIREARPGETVGYDATFKFEQESLIATVALGYGDGLPRAASNRASAFLNGATAPLVGKVSMDYVTLDVTDLPERPEVGDIVEFFGPDLAIHEAAAACNTIAYELLTGLGGRVDRRYV